LAVVVSWDITCPSVSINPPILACTVATEDLGSQIDYVIALISSDFWLTLILAATEKAGKTESDVNLSCG
jgi:hypothetical protein